MRKHFLLVAALCLTLGSCHSNDSKIEDWDEAIESYEEIINDYIRIVEKAKEGDTGYESELESLKEKGGKLEKQFNDAEKADKLSKEQIEKIQKMIEKYQDKIVDL